MQKIYNFVPIKSYLLPEYSHELLHLTFLKTETTLHRQTGKTNPVHFRISIF